MAAELINMCAWCKKIHVAGEWRTIEPPKDVDITHGICPECLKKLGEKSGIDYSDLAESNPTPYPAGTIRTEFHEHPTHGWIDPEGNFHFTKGHHRWAYDRLITSVPTLDKSERPHTEAYFMLLHDGWVATGPAYAMLVDRMNKKQVAALGKLILDHVPQEVMDGAWYLDILTGGYFKTIWVSHRELALANTWGAIMKRAHNG